MESFEARRDQIPSARWRPRHGCLKLRQPRDAGKWTVKIEAGDLPRNLSTIWFRWSKESGHALPLYLFDISFAESNEAEPKKRQG
jgi:hypothetical protein